MGYDLQRLRSVRPMDDMVSLLREEYPKMDKPLLSKCLNEGYGVQLKPDALEALGQRFDSDGWEKRRSRDRHKLKDRVVCRLTREELEEFSAYYRRDYYPDAGACVRALIRAYVDAWIERDLCDEERRDRDHEFLKHFYGGQL